MENYKGKKILIGGLGKSGQAVFDVLSAEAEDVDIYVYDQNDIEQTDPNFWNKLIVQDIPAYIGGTAVPDLDWDIVILSPGIPVDSDFVRNAAARGTKIIGELEFAYESLKGNFIAVTGTNGKTTTTALLGEIFKKNGSDTIIGGNIGIPLISFAGIARDDTVIVSEVSSFQLETISHFKPKVSAILNLTPDHLNRHKTMEVYGETKARIFMNQNKNDYLVYNLDCPDIVALVRDANAALIPFSRLKEVENGAFIKDNRLVIKDAKKLIDIVTISELKIPGEHNIENALAAAAMAYFAGVDPEAIRKTLREFDGVEHRLELVSTKNGVRFINDSKGTNPDASIKAIEAVGKDILLIAGGYDKKIDFHEFVKSFDGRVRELILVGETAELIKDTAEEMGFTDSFMCESMDEAVKTAYDHAVEGDTVLLSPANASWGMYKNYEVRGDHFKELVRELD